MLINIIVFCANTFSCQFATTLHFGELVANSYEFVQSMICVFIRFAYSPIMIICRGEGWTFMLAFFLKIVQVFTSYKFTLVNEKKKKKHSCGNNFAKLILLCFLHVLQHLQSEMSSQ